jgi:group I intron endonuclease
MTPQEERTHYLYTVTNLIDLKVYVGQTTDPDRRWYQHKWCAENDPKGCPYLYRAIKKHGVDNFQYEVVGIYESLDSINQAEEWFINAIESTMACVGYNIALGGDNQTRSPETRRKISDTLTKLCNTPEFRQHAAEWSNDLWKDPKHRVNVRKKLKAHSAIPSVKQKRQEGARMLWQDPTYRGKVIEAVKLGSSTPKERERRRKSQQGEKGSAAKLTEAQAIEVLRLALSGMPLTQVGKIFGITFQQVSKIKRGERWAHLSARTGTVQPLPVGAVFPSGRATIR